MKNSERVKDTPSPVAEKYSAHVDMQRYRWPGHEIQLLGELQRQQNSAQFCDTLLQTEGISVPTHSCVLAALSPYLSQKLSASPSPPLGQKRQLQLQAVKPQTLLKLVGLLYSGELEVKGSVELNDVLSAAHQFGITDLVVGRKESGVKEGEHQRKSFRKSREGGERYDCRKMQDAQVQADMAGCRAADCPLERRSCVSGGTQPVKAGEKTADTSSTHSGQTKSPTQKPASSAAQSLDIRPQSVSLDKHLHSTCLPPIPSRPPSDGEPASHRSSDGVTNPTSTSALSADVTSFPVSPSDDSNSPLPQTDSSGRPSSEFWERTGTSALAEKTNGEMADKREDTERPSLAKRDEIRGEGRGSRVERKHAHADDGKKSLNKLKRMQQMMETTQISIKVKLRRSTKGKVWEVVSMQDTDETSSALTALKQANPAPSSAHPNPIHKPDTPSLHPAPTNSPEPPPPHPNTTSESDSRLLCSDRFPSNQNPDLDSAPLPLPQPPGPAEESDEQIEKLLEDIMMGLNILPDMETDCKKSHHPRPSLDGALAACQVPGPECDRSAVSAAGCVYWQEFGTPIGHSSTDTGVHCCFTAQNRPSCSNLSSDAVLIQQQQQRSPHRPSSVTSTGRRDGASHQSTPLSNSQNCPYPEALAPRSVLPSAFYSSGQKPLDPARREPSARDAQSVLEFLPLTDGNEAQSSHPFSPPCMDHLRLPPCLSPLQPFVSAPKHQSVLNNPTNQSDNSQPQPSLHGRSWLAVHPGWLQFPLSSITRREKRNVSVPQDANRSCWSKQRQKHLELNTQNRVESCAVKEGGTASAGHQDAAEVKSDHRKMKESLKCNEGDTKGDATAPKKRRRKRTSCPQTAAAASLLTAKDVKVSDGAKSQIGLSVCSVRLSSNNVLAKEREMAASSANIRNRFLGNPDEPSTITESHGEKTKEDNTQIRTRSFLKRAQETPSNTSLKNVSVSKLEVRRAEIVNEQGVSVPKRKRGRPPRAKLEESPPAVGEEKSHGVESEQQIGNSLPNEGEKTKRRWKKPRRSRREVEVIPREKIRGVNDETAPAERKHRPRMVSLKEFKKLIKRQHSRSRKSTESRRNETNETKRGVESEERACGSRCEEFIKETEMDQSRDGVEGCHIADKVTVDKNHNQIFNKSQRESSSLLGNENDPMSAFDVSGEEVAEREQPLKNPDEAKKACDAAVSDMAQQNAIIDIRTPAQEDKMPLGHNLNPVTPERTAPPLLIKEEEEEDEVDVDVVLYSPDKVPQSRVCDNRLDNMDVTPEEEEEEDVNEIDVTGDEAE